MGKRRSEDDGLDTGFCERSRPAEDQAGDRLLEISVLVRQMTRRIFWRVVVLQNQQTRALPEWQ